MVEDSTRRLRRAPGRPTPSRMTRDRLLRPRWLVWLLVVWGMAIASAPRSGEAAPLPPERAAGVPDDRSAGRSILEEPAVRAQLAALGVSDADATALWERLTPAERTELTARARELGTGGDPVAAAVAIAIVVAMFVILALELIGRRIISRPSPEPER